MTLSVPTILDNEMIAATYTRASAEGRPPTLAVARLLNISPGAAAQRVRRVRLAGYKLPAGNSWYANADRPCPASCPCRCHRDLA